jgi:hypothetical protein
MQTWDIERLVKEIQIMEVTHPPDTPIPMPLHCKVIPPTVWDRSTLEKTLGITLPQDLVFLWNNASSIRLFEDVTYGQWGFILWSSDQVIEEQEQRIARRKEDYRQGDLILGEFLGDSDLLVMRCNAAEQDFGHLMISLPLYPRADWYVAAHSLGEFLSNFMRARYFKYWER